MNGEAKRWRGWTVALLPSASGWPVFLHDRCGGSVDALGDSYRDGVGTVEFEDVIDGLIIHEGGCTP